MTLFGGRAASAAGLGSRVPAKAKAAFVPIDMPRSDALSIQNK